MYSTRKKKINFDETKSKSFPDYEHRRFNEQISILPPLHSVTTNYQQSKIMICLSIRRGYERSFRVLEF